MTPIIPGPNEAPLRRKTDEPGLVSWGLKREIDIGHLLMTLMTLGAFFGWALRQEGRFVAVETGITELRKDRSDTLTLINQQHTETRQDIKELSVKFDLILERRAK